MINLLTYHPMHHRRIWNQYWKQILLWYFRWYGRRRIIDCQLKSLLNNNLETVIVGFRKADVLGFRKREPTKAEFQKATNKRQEGWNREKNWENKKQKKGKICTKHYIARRKNKGAERRKVVFFKASHLLRWNSQSYSTQVHLLIWLNARKDKENA